MQNQHQNYLEEQNFFNSNDLNQMMSSNNDFANFEKQEKSGFEVQNLNADKIFDLIPRDFPVNGFQSDEQIRRLAANKVQIILLTNKRRIFRWNFKETYSKILELPKVLADTSGTIGVAEKLLGVSGTIFKAMTFQGAKKETVLIDEIYMDQQGNHMMLSSLSGENFYLHKKAPNIIYLPKLKGQIITSVAWDANAPEYTTSDILLGTSTGQIIQYKINYLPSAKELGVLESLQGQTLKGVDIVEAVIKAVFALPTQIPITQLQFVFLLQENRSKINVIICSTTNSIYCFYGSSSFEALFEKYKTNEEVKKCEIPFPRSNISIMHVLFYQNDEFNNANSETLSPHSFIWTNGKASINCYTFPQQQKDVTVNNIVNLFHSPQALRYAKLKDQPEERAYMVQETPLAMVLTEYHYALLHKDALTIMSRISEKVVAEFDLSKHGQMKGMHYEHASHTIWVYSSFKVFQLLSRSDEVDAWQLYLDRKMYKEAYQLARRRNTPELPFSTYLFADQLLKEGNSREAAQLLSRLDTNFEESVLKFITLGEELEQGVECFMSSYMNKLTESQRPQKQLILAFLLELKINKLNVLRKNIQLGKEVQRSDALVIYEITQQRDTARKDLEAFLVKHQTNFNEQLASSLMISHGQFKNCIFFAEIRQNFENIIIHLINEEQYGPAIEKLKVVWEDQLEALIYKYCHILMRFEAEKMVHFLINCKLQHQLDPTRLICGLMEVPINKREHAINFLYHCIDKLECQEKAIYNILIFFLAESEDAEAQLEHFLDKQESFLQENEILYFDLDYALRIFKRKNLIEAQISVYSMMGLYMEAINLALEHDKFEKAKLIANKPNLPKLSKQLWLQIAIILFQKQKPIKEIIQLTKDSKLIKIEDLLPYFNEDTKIENCKEEICNALTEYSNRIEGLKVEMEGFSQNAEKIKAELKNLQDKYLIINGEQKCEECQKSLFYLNQEFYVFPCQHAYHTECLLKRFQELDMEEEIHELAKIQNQINSLKQKTEIKIMQKQQENKGLWATLFSLKDKDNKLGGGENQTQVQKQSLIKTEAQIQQLLSQDDYQLYLNLKQIYDDIIAAECIDCGFQIIKKIYQPLASNMQGKSSWDI